MESRVKFRENAERFVGAARPQVQNVLVFKIIDSTHACSLRLIEQAEAEEIVLPTTLIMANEQTRGQGRAGRSWTSPSGGLYLSWIAAELDSKTTAQLPMVAAATAHEAVRRLGIVDVAIKWPNDLLVGGRKLAGLLIHARHGETIWAVVSLGINLDHGPEITDGSSHQATSVADHLGDDGKTRWAEEIIRVFVEQMADGIETPERLIATWRNRLVHRPGDEMVVRIGDGSEIRGTFAGLTPEGHLRLDCDGDERTVTAGDVLD